MSLDYSVYSVLKKSDLQKHLDLFLKDIDLQDSLYVHNISDISNRQKHILEEEGHKSHFRSYLYVTANKDLLSKFRQKLALFIKTLKEYGDVLILLNGDEEIEL